MSRRVVTLIATALGLALLAWQIEKIGLAELLDGLHRIGIPGLALILGASLVRQVARAKAWTLLIGPETPLPLGSGLAATISGDAIGNLTPLSLIVSEPAKAMYVRAHVPPPRALAALAAENFFYSLSVAVAVLIGVAVLFLAFPVPDQLRTASLIIVAGMGAVLVAALWLIVKEPALVSSTLGRLVSNRVLEKIRELEVSSYAFVRSHPGRLAGVVAWEVTFHIFSIAETWITLAFLGIHSLGLAVVLDTVQRVINVVFRVVPLKIGVDEVGSGLTSAALGFGSPLGVTMGVIRKIRVLVWAGVGIVILFGQRAEGKGQR
jgi:hypothetical protein